VLPLRVVLRALLNAVTILHQPSFLPITVRPYNFGKLGARLLQSG
jgi:hypothetical protein